MNLSTSSIFAAFPGQGSQYVGMGKDLYENFPIVRETFEEASEAIHVELKSLCFNGPHSDLILTENTQPCLLVCSVSAFRVVQQEFDFIPGAVAGHSIGEYAALVASNSLNLGTATYWVKERGLAMQKAVPEGEGSMLALLGVDTLKAELLCKKATQIAREKRLHYVSDSQNSVETISIQAVVEPANFNAPGQIVVAGSIDAIEETIGLTKSEPLFFGIKTIPLQVSAPFHCCLMEPAKNRMAELFSQASMKEKPRSPLFQYIPNRTARFSKDKELILNHLIEQVDHPVLWHQSIETLLEAGFTTGIEFGPGKILCGLIKRIAMDMKKKCDLVSIQESSSLKTLSSLLKSHSFAENS